MSDSDDSEPVDPQCTELEKRSKVMEDIQKRMYEKAKRNIKQAQDRQKKQYDKRRCPILFKYGDKVLHKNLLRNDRKVAGLLKGGMVHTRFSSAWGKTPTN